MTKSLNDPINRNTSSSAVPPPSHRRNTRFHRDNTASNFDTGFLTGVVPLRDHCQGKNLLLYLRGHIPELLPCGLHQLGGLVYCCSVVSFTQDATTQRAGTLKLRQVPLGTMLNRNMTQNDSNTKKIQFAYTIDLFQR